MRNGLHLGALVLWLTASGCEGVAEWVELPPFRSEAFADILLDAEAENGVHRPDPVLTSRSVLYGFGGQTVYRLVVSGQEWTAEPLGRVPDTWEVQGLALDPADDQRLLLLVKEAPGGVYRVYRGTGRKEWTLFATFTLPLRSEAGRPLVRPPVRGLAAFEDQLVFVSEYIERDEAASSLGRATLETFAVSLDKAPLFPERVFAAGTELVQADESGEFPSYFAPRDLACTTAFTRRAFALNQLVEERNCLTHPMAVGSRAVALRHGSKTLQEGVRATLTRLLTEATALSPLPDSHLLLLARDGGLELYDSWLEEGEGQSLARLDRHLPRFLSSGVLDTPPALSFLAGVDRRSNACALESTNGLFAQLRALPPTGTRAEASSVLKRELQIGRGPRCACAFLAQTQNFLKKNEPGAETLWVQEVEAAVSQEASQQGCVLPGSIQD